MLIRIVCVRLDHGHFSCRTNISVVFIHCRTQIQINCFQLVMCLFCFVFHCLFRCCACLFCSLCVFSLKLFTDLLWHPPCTRSSNRCFSVISLEFYVFHTHPQFGLLPLWFKSKIFFFLRLSALFDLLTYSSHYTSYLYIRFWVCYTHCLFDSFYLKCYFFLSRFTENVIKVNTDAKKYTVGLCLNGEGTCILFNAMHAV